MAEEKTFSAKQVATRIGTDAKQLRKFFRDPKSGYTSVGQGGRYDFPESDLAEIKQKFDAWSSTKTRRNRTKAVVSAGGVSHASALPPQSRRPRVSEQPKPRIIITSEEAEQMNSGPHNKVQSIVEAEERPLEDDDQYFEEGFDFDEEAEELV